MKKEQLVNMVNRPRKPKPISIAYDAHNMQMMILCDDGTLWRRYSRRDPEMGEITWKWEKIEELDLK